MIRPGDLYSCPEPIEGQPVSRLVIRLDAGAAVCWTFGAGPAWRTYPSLDFLSTRCRLVAVDLDVPGPPMTGAALSAAVEAVRLDRPIAAADILVDYFDGLFAAGDFEGARLALAELDPHILPPKVITAVLMVTAPAREKLGGARDDFFSRARAALAETWKFKPEALAAVEARFA